MEKSKIGEDLSNIIGLVNRNRPMLEKYLDKELLNTAIKNIENVGIKYFKAVKKPAMIIGILAKELKEQLNTTKDFFEFIRKNKNKLLILGLYMNTLGALVLHEIGTTGSFRSAHPFSRFEDKENFFLNGFEQAKKSKDKKTIEILTEICSKLKEIYKQTHGRKSYKDDWTLTNYLETGSQIRYELEDFLSKKENAEFYAAYVHHELKGHRFWKEELSTYEIKDFMRILEKDK